jgi:dTDP-4-dehydrorhamnose reductase
MGNKSTKRPDIWGGLECSFNRVKNLYMDQLLYCGHYNRAVADIDLIASLGISAMRYPVIWERLHPSPGHSIDWSSVEEPLNALVRNKITPIVGLVHHGSGPAYADILQPTFATGLAGFAAQVAEKFPWIEYYTPVNEPLTTARFCGLYGLWFPHRKNDRAFVQTLLNELKGVVLSMQEIRKINPDAKLVQTEDLAKVYSTPHLQYQARFENRRRWLTYDFLCGKVTPDHPLWRYFLKAGATESQLYFFSDNRCPPDIIGVDYYATSERYLDEDLAKYPQEKHGSNRRERYADVEAFRVMLNEPSGIQVLLKECWDRFHLPIAVTEVHINCDYDNQIRWFAEIRDTCSILLEKGIDIRAVTAWTLYGSYGWNKLLTVTSGEYESGAFDVQTGIPKPTPVADYLRMLANDPAYVHPVQAEKGWWRLEDRFIFDRYSEELSIGDNGNKNCLTR